MSIACEYVRDMPKMIQIRNVRDSLHRTLKARAALAGMSLSGYLMQEIKQIAERPTMEELRDRIRRRTAVHPRETPADAVRAERGRQ